MTDQQDQKERLREQRLASEQADQHRARVKSLLGYGLAAVLALAVVGGAAIALTSGGGSGGGGTASAEAAFGTHYSSLESRRTGAGVPTMMDTMSSTVHIHPHIAVYANGKEISIPPNIGIDPSQPSMQMAGLHTHDSSGTIHDEGMAGARLGQFFVIWGVPFSAQRLGPYAADATHSVRMWVDGEPSDAFGALPLADGQQIVVAYGDSNAPPPPLG
jgi:hypothetical protein